MSTILSRVSGLRIQAFAPELGNISSSDFSGRSEISTIGMSRLFDCDLSTSLRRLPLMLGRLTSRKMMSGVFPASTWLNSIQLDAVSTVQPSRSSRARPSLSTSGLSSRIRTVTLDKAGIGAHDNLSAPMTEPHLTESETVPARRFVWPADYYSAPTPPSVLPPG